MLEVVREIISQEIDVAAESIKLESNLRNDLQIDSLAAVNLSFELENRFDIKITDVELAGFTSVGDIVALLEAKGVTAAS